MADGKTPLGLFRLDLIQFLLHRRLRPLDLRILVFLEVTKGRFLRPNYSVHQGLRLASR